MDLGSSSCQRKGSLPFPNPNPQILYFTAVEVIAARQGGLLKNLYNFKKRVIALCLLIPNTSDPQLILHSHPLLFFYPIKKIIIHRLALCMYIGSIISVLDVCRHFVDRLIGHLEIFPGISLGIMKNLVFQLFCFVLFF